MSGGQSAFLLQAPRTEEDWERWAWAHRLSHDAIREAIQAQKNINLVDYPVYPIDLKQAGVFLQNNSQAHIDINAALNLPDQDIQDVDLQDERQRQAWIFIHWKEHNDAEAKLNI